MRIRLGTRPLVTSAQEVENTNVQHSTFVAEASKSRRWKEGDRSNVSPGNNVEVNGEDVDSLTEGKGKLSPTASHLFKLILPLGDTRHPQDKPPSSFKSPPPTVFLLHPSQPLSHVGRLVIASLAPVASSVSFRSRTPRGRDIQWSDSTDVADFIRYASREREFTVCISSSPLPPAVAPDPASPSDAAADTLIPVEVPSFADRTRFLRRRLARIEHSLARLESLKRECDHAARRGARRMAVGGFGVLLVYWGAVARLTFWDYGWDVMEPITYLSGLSIVVLSYLWFLYRGRDMSYESLLHQSVSARREALYKARGLDVDRWMDLVSESKAVRREISKIGEDYDERRFGGEEDGKVEAAATEEDTRTREVDEESLGSALIMTKDKQGR
ncbi:uncharacterized protein BXZ73DRAFT_45800 [Epithele typhae]|uniref:uncharacterized protein n=1 Tax=Epithele typhae TaxID=378194 RepID=UPI0020088928|nr:uncharacterized protein BXZ73DRAFT_45800 [Epithele typhae]KAH9934539.1 hypothetical protein BXZ73DRAFT_45800 [Epithele typhae]